LFSAPRKYYFFVPEKSIFQRSTKKLFFSVSEKWFTQVAKKKPPSGFLYNRFSGRHEKKSFLQFPKIRFYGAA
jgi:hypothetical protein